MTVATASSSTWSRISASSSTSEAAPAASARLVAWLRLTHPFPSVLDGVVSAGIALLAGGPPDVAVRLGAAMTLLQLGIGTTNDVVDAPRDAGHKPGKPIPAGLVAAGSARGLALIVFAVGLLIAASVGSATAALSVLVIAIGLAYDLRLKGTAWSWLPFAIGIPILPIYGWLGATGGLDPAFAVLIPAAVAAGAALAIGNALVDLERDRAAGVSSVAVALGERRATDLACGLLVAVALAAAGSAAVLGASSPAIVGVIAAGMFPAAAAIAGRGRGPAAREWAWRVETVGLAALAAAWLIAVPR